VTRGLSRSAARRAVLARQGLLRPRPHGRVDIRHVRRVFGDVGVVQIDSVNVLARAHHLALYSRLGPYPVGLLVDAAYRRRELFEYWSHEASLLPVSAHPLHRWEMERARDGRTFRELARFAAEHAAYVAAVEDEVAERGPLTVSELSEPGARSGPWWGWSEGKTALEWLFAIGRVTVAERRNFSRVYDLTERVIPHEVLALPTPEEEDAIRALTVAAVRSLGIASLQGIADYHRLKTADVRPQLSAALEDGDIVGVDVEGWDRRRTYAPADLRVPRAAHARALVSPFDSLVWHRERTERLFDFRYRIEIYTPREQRVHGYYVLPFVLGEDLVARVDLKADRGARALLVPGAFTEDGRGAGDVGAALAEELRDLATWLGLESVWVGERGDLVRPLAAALGDQ
jgi:uncharacterized protein